MKVQFREYDHFNLWLWLKLSMVPSDQEKNYLVGVLESWFMLGKLGGFNAENLQIQEVGLDLNYMEYDHDNADNTMLAVMHNMGELEYKGKWVRCWVDLGTADALALDILVNAFRQLDQEYFQIEKLIIGGQNPDWPVEVMSDDNYDNNYLG